MAELAGTVSLVMGASQGIGAEIANALAQDGSTVVLCSRRRAAVDAVAQQIRARGHSAQGLACDVSEFASVQKTVGEVYRRFGRIDHLVNNAALVEPLAPIIEADPTRWATAVRVGLTGTFNGCRAVLPLLTAQGSGVIVNMASGAADAPLEGWSAYNATKAAALSLFNTMALEVAQQAPDLRVYSFRPGAVATGMLDTIRSSGLGYVAHLPPKDLLPPELPARVVAWLVRREAADLSGQDLSIRDPELRRRVGLPERHYG